jgi:hypothetical protein
MNPHNFCNNDHRISLHEQVKIKSNNTNPTSNKQTTNKKMTQTRHVNYPTPQPATNKEANMTQTRHANHPTTGKTKATITHQSCAHPLAST